MTFKAHHDLKHDNPALVSLETLLSPCLNHRNLPVPQTFYDLTLLRDLIYVLSTPWSNLFCLPANVYYITLQDSIYFLVFIVPSLLLKCKLHATEI